MTSEFPDWASFTPARAAADLPRLLAESETAVAALETASPTTFEGFVWRLDDATRELGRCWGAVAHMLSVANAEAWRKVERDAQPKIVAFHLRVGQSRRLYELAKACLADDPTCRVGPRRRILEEMVKGAERAGVGLDGAAKARFNEIQMRLAQLSADYHNAVLDATTPEIADAAYIESMKHNPDRALRARLYRARNTRAPENAPRADEILKLRQEMAELLGFADYAAMSLETKCAHDAATVMKMIDGLDAATRDGAAREAAALEANVAATRTDGDATIQPWDLSYEAERLRERTYAYSEEELKRHFELEDVLAGLFRMTKALFGVDVEEVAERPSAWHDDVRFFAVREDGETLAHFYFDPFVRPGTKSGGAWMNEFRNRNGRLGTKPLALVSTNFPVRDASGTCFLVFREVETLFHEFGHALQCMLTRIDEEDAAGINLVEHDAIEIASQFMENWCLDDRTGLAVPEELKAKVRAAKTFRAATSCRRQLAFAKTDLLLHSAGFCKQPTTTADDVRREVFDHFGVPTIPDDRFLCAFTHVFAGGYAAGYYGYKWAEVMSADCYGAFEEAGLDDDNAVRSVGRRLRETLFARGGSASARDVFRAFRGRDPEIAALLRQQGLA